MRCKDCGIQPLRLLDQANKELETVVTGKHLGKEFDVVDIDYVLQEISRILGKAENGIDKQAHKPMKSKGKESPVQESSHELGTSSPDKDKTCKNCKKPMPKKSIGDYCTRKLCMEQLD